MMKYKNGLRQLKENNSNKQLFLQVQELFNSEDNLNIILRSKYNRIYFIENLLKRNCRENGKIRLFFRFRCKPLFLKNEMDLS